MSTILNALKKLEQERESRGGNDFQSGPDFNTRRIVHRAYRYAWLSSIGMRCAVAVIIILMVVAGAFFFQDKDNQASLPPPIMTDLAGRTDHQPDQDLRSNLTTGAKQRRDPLEKETALPPGINARNHPAAKQTAQGAPPESVLPNGISPTSSPAEKNRQAFQKKAVSPQPHTQDQEPAEVTTSVSQPLRSEDPDVAETGEIERLTDGTIKIQAIAWAPQPMDRMAVVNNRVVHEGDSLDSFSILTINQDDIIVRLKGQVWKVPFGRH